MEQTLLYLSKADVEACRIKMREVISTVESVFVEKGHGRVEMPPKPGVHSRPDSFIHAMPAFVPKDEAIGIKWVSGYPNNLKKGLPYINGLLILNDPDTGIPLSVMDCVWVTAMRTGAATAVSAKCLARPDSSVLGILGAGVQGFTNLLALREIFPIRTVVVYDIDPDQVDRYEDRVRGTGSGIDVVRAATPRQAVQEMDMVVTAGPILKVPHATIKKGWLSPGAFASLVDFDSYWDREALVQVDRFTTDDIGQLKHYRELGFFSGIPEVYADLGELVAGLKPGRGSATERTIACNLGLAIEDIAVAKLIYRKAVRLGLGTRLAL